MNTSMRVALAALADACRWGIRTVLLWVALAALAGAAQASVSITSPRNNEVFNNQTTVTIRGTIVTAVAGGTTVQIYTIIDGDEQFCTSTASGTRNYECLEPVGLGNHTARVKIRIRDVLGRSTEQFSNIVAFTMARSQDVAVTIDSPANNATVASPFTLDARATTSVLGGLQGGERLRIDTYLDAALVVSAEQTSGGARDVRVRQSVQACRGVHTLRAVGTFVRADQSTVTSETSIRIAVNRPATLTVSGLAPAPGSVVQGSGVTLAARAEADCLVPGDTMTLALFLDNVRVASTTSATDRVLSLDRPLYAEQGSHTLRAVAQIVAAGGAVVSQTESSTFAVAQPALSLLVLGNGPGSFVYPVSTVLRYDAASGAFRDYFVGRPSAPMPASVSNPCRPLDMTYGPDGNFYVLDESHSQDYCRNANVVSRFDGRTGEYNEVDDAHAAFIRSAGLLSSYGGLAFGADGTLYISNYGNVQRYQGPFDPEPGQFLGMVTSSELLQARVGHLRFGPDGNLYVLTEGPDNVLKVDMSTHSVQPFVSAATLNGPRELRFGPEGDLYVANATGGNIARYAGPGKPDAGTLISQLRTFAFPDGLDFGPDGDLYVMAGDFRQPHGVHRYSRADGTYKGLLANVERSVNGTMLLSSIPLPDPGLGDFNRDGCVDLADYNVVIADVRSSGQHDLSHDLNGDGLVTIADVRKLTLLFTHPKGAACQ